MIAHSYKLVQTPFGPNKVLDERCFLNINEYNTVYGAPTMKCEDCVGDSKCYFCIYCQKFNNRPNFKSKEEQKEEEQNEWRHTYGDVWKT